jgi:hypothetical protein
MRMPIKGSLKAILITSVAVLAVVGAVTPVEARGGGGQGGGGAIMGGGNMLGGFSKGAFTGEGFTGGSNVSQGTAGDFEAHPFGAMRPARSIGQRPDRSLPSYGW